MMGPFLSGGGSTVVDFIKSVSELPKENGVSGAELALDVGVDFAEVSLNMEIVIH